jgi:hypothetical protein
MKSIKRTHYEPFTKRKQAALLRLYLGQHLPAPDTARRLGLDPLQVREFLRARRLLRGRGNPGVPRKLTVSSRQELISQLPVTTDVVLARKYGVTRENVRQIRQRFGYPSSRIIRSQQMARARAKREQQERRAVELRRQLRRAKRLQAANRLSKRWKSGAPISVLAREFGILRSSMQTRISRIRKEFPGKIPLRHRPRNRRLL